MEQKIINKKYIVSVIKNGKVIDLLTGRSVENLKCILLTKYKGCQSEIMEFEEQSTIFVRSLKDHFLMIRRRTKGNILK